jgi:hypothetical protein
MTQAKMFEGDLWVLASDAIQMSENAYKKGQTDEREECAKVCEDSVEYAGDELARQIRARGQA